MTDRRRDSALIELAIDAVRVTDDYVRGVLQNAEGRAGGGEHVDRGWRRWVPRVGVYGEKHVVQGMTGQYAPEQLRKAARAADEMVVAIDELANAWTPPALDAHGQLEAIRVREVAQTLRRSDVGARSPELREVHEQLTRTIAVLNEARTKVILAEMRAARDDAG